MKVLIIGPYPWDTDDLFAGGVMHAVAYLIDILKDKDKIELHILSYTKKTKRTERIKKKNINIIFISNILSAIDYFLGFRILLWRLRKEIVRISPDIVHAQGDPAPILAAVEGNIPYVVTVHGLFQNETKTYHSRTNIKYYLSGFFLRLAEKRYRAKIKYLISTTDEVENTIKKYSRDVRVFRNNNPIEREYFNLPNKEERQIILFVARITQRKGLHLLLEAFSRIADDYSECNLRIIGSERQATDYLIELKAKYRMQIQIKRISFLGGVDQSIVKEELSRCSMLCLPSLAESAPMVISQAMAAGKPVIASRVGGIPEMIESGRTGILIEKANIDELEKAIRYLLDNPEIRSNIGNEARLSAIEKYSAENVAQKTIEIYESIISEEKRERY